MGNANKGSTGIDKALVYHHNGNTKYELGDYKGAVIDYSESLRLKPNKRDVLIMRGHAHTYLGDYKGAIDDFNSVLCMNPNDFHAYINLGWVHGILENYEVALHHYTKALDLKPLSKRALNERAMIYQIIGDARNAKKDRKKAKSADKMHHFVESASSLADWQKSISEQYLARAINEMKKPSGNYKLAFMYCNEAIRLQCENPDAYFYRTEAYNMMINEEPGIDRDSKYEICMMYDEDYHGPLPDALSYLRRGNEKLESTDYSEAIDDYNESLRLDPNNEEALLNRGIAQCSQGNYKKGMRDYNIFLSRNSQNASAFANRGWALSQLENYKDALSDYNKALELEPDYVHVLNHRAILYQITGEIEKAETDIQKARLFEKDHYTPEYKKHVSKEYLACAKRELEKENGNPKAALVYCDEAIRLESKDMQAYLCRIQIYNKFIDDETTINDLKKINDDLEQIEILRSEMVGKYKSYPSNYNADLAKAFKAHGDFQQLVLHDFKGAVDNYTKSLYLDPNNVDTLIDRGIANAKLGNYVIAIIAFQAVIDTHPENFSALSNRGWVNSVLGNYNAALDDYNKSLALAPSNANTLNNRAILYRIMGEDKKANEDIQIARFLEREQYNTLVNKNLAIEYINCATNIVRNENGNLKAALIYCNEAIRLEGANPNAYLCRAQIYDRMLNHSKAEIDKDHAKFLILYPEISMQLYNAIAEGKKDAALNYLKIFSEQAPLSVPIAINPLGETEPVLLTLARSGHTDWLDDFIMYKNLNIDEKDKYDNLPLHMAAAQGNIEFFKKLMSYHLISDRKSEGDSLTAFNLFGLHPLHYAALMGKIEFLMDAYQIELFKNNFEASTLSGDTILHLLTDNGHTRELITLLEQSSSLSVQKTNDAGQNVFMRAIINKPSNEDQTKQQYELLELLLKRHTDIHARDQQGLTALHWAVQTNQMKIVEFLLAKGALIDSRDKEGKLPSDYTTPDSPIGILLEDAKQRKIPNVNFLNEKTKWENLVFEGGGVKGLAFISALRALEEGNVISLDNIKRVGGTSAGAITALLVGLGFSFDEIEHLSNIKTLEGCTLPQIKFSELLDGPHGATILATKNKDWSKESKLCEQLTSGPIGAIKASLKGTAKVIANAKTLKNTYYPMLKELNSNLGVCSGKTLYDLADMLIRHQYAKKLGKKVEEITQPITFQQLRDAAFKELYFVGVNTETGLVEYFSHEKTPHMLVANAVRISMSIPGVFTPQPQITRDEKGQQQESKALYVDGGVLLNYPIRLFDYELDEKGHFDRDGLPKINKATLGLRLNPKNASDEPDSKAHSTASAMGMFKSLGTNYQESDHRLNGDVFRTVYINVSSIGIGTLDFERVEEEHAKRLLTQIGIVGAREFIERSHQHSQTLSMGLPEDIEKIYLNHLIIVGRKLSKKNKVKPIYKLNPQCPALVLAFYKHDEKELHDYLHNHLGILLCASDQHGMTAFHLAARQGDMLTLKRLLTVSPDEAHKKNKDGKSPYQLALEEGHTEVIALLKTYTNEMPAGNSDSKNEVKCTGTSVNQFFKPIFSNTKSASDGYTIELNDIKTLLEQLGKHDFEAYATYALKLSEIDKISGTYQAVAKLQEIKKELKIRVASLPITPSVLPFHELELEQSGASTSRNGIVFAADCAGNILSWQNNCAFNCMIHTLLDTLRDPTLSEPLTNQGYLDFLTTFNIYYDIDPPANLQQFRSIMEAYLNPADQEILLGPVLRTQLSKLTKLHRAQDRELLLNDTSSLRYGFMPAVERYLLYGDAANDEYAMFFKGNLKTFVSLTADFQKYQSIDNIEQLIKEKEQNIHGYWENAGYKIPKHWTFSREECLVALFMQEEKTQRTIRNDWENGAYENYTKVLNEVNQLVFPGDLRPLCNLFQFNLSVSRLTQNRSGQQRGYSEPAVLIVAQNRPTVMLAYNGHSHFEILLTDSEEATHHNDQYPCLINPAEESKGESDYGANYKLIEKQKINAALRPKFFDQLNNPDAAVVKETIREDVRHRVLELSEKSLKQRL